MSRLFSYKYNLFVNFCRNYNRVVVTGLGLVCPLGVGVQHVWTRLLKGDIGVSSIIDKEYSEVPCKVAAFVPKGVSDGQFNISNLLKETDIKTCSLHAIYSLVAAEEALNDSNWFPTDEYEKEQTGVAIGTGMVDLKDIINEGNTFSNRGYKKVSPYFISKILTNLSTGHISIKYGFKGPNHSVSTACAAGAHSVGDAFNFIKLGHASVMVCGATEAVISPLSLSAFSRIRALSTKFNATPSKASRPFDENHDGFVMGEGAGVLILESLEHAIARKAKIYAEILGYGLSGDAHHIAAPAPDGRGAYLSMISAIKNSSVSCDDIEYVNAHATSTALGDAGELKVIEKVCGKHSKNVFVSSTKGAIGHLLGAAGSVETIFTVMACFTGNIPPTVNLDKLCYETDLKVVANNFVEWKTTDKKRRIALKNSFGFGGTNASLVVSSIQY